MLPEWLILELSQFQLYGLVFLLGSFTVATLSDLKYMKAQTEFVEIWVLSFVFLVAVDIWKIEDADTIQFSAKWILIIIFMVVSNMRVGLLFKLAFGDILAAAAIMALLTPGLIVVMILALKIFDFLLRPILRQFGTRGAYPFMPVVMTATITIVAIGFYLAERAMTITFP